MRPSDVDALLAVLEDDSDPGLSAWASRQRAGLYLTELVRWPDESEGRRVVDVLSPLLNDVADRR